MVAPTGGITLVWTTTPRRWRGTFPPRESMRATSSWPVKHPLVKLTVRSTTPVSAGQAGPVHAEAFSHSVGPGPAHGEAAPFERCQVALHPELEALEPFPHPIAPAGVGVEYRLLLTGASDAQQGVDLALGLQQQRPGRLADSQLLDVLAELALQESKGV